MSNLTARLWLPAAAAAAFTLLGLTLRADPLPGEPTDVNTVDQLLQASQAPAGVVFEIVTRDPNGLSWAVPWVQDQIQRLRVRFPELSIAVVSHGREQFALQRAHAEQQRNVQELTRSLVSDDITLHVCGTYAERRGITDEDFVDFVNVAAAGPAQVNDYVALGYLRIKIKKRPE